MKQISFYEFNAYCKCPLLWDNVYRKKNTVTKPISYKDLAFKSNCNEINIEGCEDVCIKAKAIHQYIKEIENETVFVLGNFYVKDNDVMLKLKEQKLSFVCGELEMALPVPDVFHLKDNPKEKIILATVITSSSGFNKPTQNTVAHFQRMALSDMFKDCNVKIAIRTIKTSSLKMKKAETDEEFEARKAELLKKSKTGTTRAQKQLGETESEFFARYKDAITYSIELEDEYFMNAEPMLINKVKCFTRDYDNDGLLAFNDHYCPFCDFNKGGLCRNMLGMSDSDLANDNVVCISAK